MNGYGCAMSTGTDGPVCGGCVHAQMTRLAYRNAMIVCGEHWRDKLSNESNGPYMHAWIRQCLCVLKV